MKVGGHIEHVHLLLLLGKTQDIAKVIQLIKGEVSHWFNKRFGHQLIWQDDYFAVSVSESLLEKVVRYIAK